jgi:monoamine oxidase
MGQAVTAVAPHGSGVTVKLADGNSLKADHVVVTVPLGVLKAGHISFAEEFSAKRQSAIEALRMGLLNKCWLRFDRIAWPDSVDWVEWLGPEDGFWAEWVSLGRSAKLPVLLGFHAGAQARTMEKLNDRDMTAAAHEALKSMFGTGFPAPRAAQVTRWSQDPLTLGSYSFVAVGASPKMRGALAGEDWDGRLVFAGEATSKDYGGTAHGALLSGRTAARTLTKS